MENNAPDDEFPEIERYELRETPRYSFDANRRQFSQLLGAGIVISLSARVSLGQRRFDRRTRSAKMSERFHLGTDGVVTVLTGKVEVGQGSRTQITQAACEELGLSVAQVRLIMADTAACPNDGGTAGSRTTPSTVPQVRMAAAALREILLKLAAERLSVPASSLVLRNGEFLDSANKPLLTLGELAKLDDFPAKLDASRADDVTITRVDQWKVLGRAIPKVNGLEVVTGAAQFPSDIVRPEMLYGKVLRPVSYGAELESIDLGPAQAMSGVTFVRDGDFLGCAAPNSWTAKRAIDAMAAAARWRRPAHPSSTELFEHLKKTASGSASGRSRGNNWGNLEAGRAAERAAVDASYTIAYVQHAPLEPRAAVAEWKDGKLTVWTGSQQPLRVRSELTSVFRLPDDHVRVIVPDTGGGFGGKHTGEAAVEAARLAQAVGKPVSLRWTRSEEFTWAYCRPAGLIEVHAGLDDAGGIVAWDFTNYNSGGSAIDTPYRTQNGRTRFAASNSPLRQGSYRALASTANTFARESMMDELAAALKIDPLEFRLRHLPAGRLRDVLQDAARRFNWPQRRANAAKGRGIGLACGTEKGSYVAACAEVEVRDGEFKVVSLCQVYECGAIQNPGNLRAQVEGCLIMGLGAALFEEMQFENGVVTTDAFSQYTVPRMKHVPELDITLRDRRDLPSVGAGETPIIAVAPAVANAVFDASGVRIRSMPLKTKSLTA